MSAVSRTVSREAVGMPTRTALPLPAFYTPAMIGELFAPDYEGILAAAAEYRAAHGILPRRQVPFNARVCFLSIDQQVTFSLQMGELSLAPASIGDTQRQCEFLYTNGHLITDKMVTLDSHFLWHIFHPVFWLTAEGKYVGKYTAILPEDIGVKYFVNPEMCGILFPRLVNPLRKLPWLQEFVLAYTRKLAADGKPPLVVWPVHGRLGHVGHGLVPAFAAALDFHDVLRYTETEYLSKGGLKLFEYYSPFGSEVLDLTVGGRTVRGRKSAAVVRRLLKYRVLIVAGEARSHCVRAGLLDILAAIKETDPSLAQRVYILEDCTSNVPGFEKQGDDALELFRANGMHVVQSTTPMTEWPGMPKEVLALAA